MGWLRNALHFLSHTSLERIDRAAVPENQPLVDGSCIFCQIARKELAGQSRIIYEDDDVISINCLKVAHSHDPDSCI